MKKTIVKVLAIVFVVSILVSSMFVMTGAACSEYTMKINYYDNANFNESGFILISYNYNKADAKLEVSNITINGWNMIGGNVSFSKKHLADSDLKFNRSEGCFQKTLIAMTSPDNINDVAGATGGGAAGVAGYMLRSAYATVKVYTGTNRAPKKGDRVYVSVSDTYGFETTSTIASIEMN